MAELKPVQTDAAPGAIGPYSQGVVVGNLVFTAGQIALDPASGELVEGDIARQTEQVFQNLAAVLAEAGTDLRKVVKTTVFLADMDDFAAMNEVYARHMGDHKPARSAVEVSRLPKSAEVLVEIEAIAVIG